ncbi:MAG: C13 family peptidase [Pseudothermotoga sp.]
MRVIYLRLLFFLLVIFLISSCVIIVEKDPMEQAAKSIATQLGLPETSQSTDDRFIIFFAAELTSGDTVSVDDPFKSLSKPFPNQTKWLFVLDKNPLAKFAHDVAYIYIDQNFEILESQDAQWMPVVNDQPIFLGDIYSAAYSKIKWKNFELTVPESVPIGELVATVPDNCALIVNGNNPERYPDVGISKDKEHMEQFYKSLYGENAVRALEYPNNTVEDFENSINVLVQGGAKSITVYISSHGSINALVMGNTRMTPEQLRSIIFNHPQTKFYVIIDACHSGSFIDDLYYDGLNNLLAIMTATDEIHLSYGDCDGKYDPNRSDSGGEWTSGFYETLVACASFRMFWDLIEYVASIYCVQVEQVLYKMAYDGAYELDCTRIAELSFPQYRGWSPSSQIIQEK